MKTNTLGKIKKISIAALIISLFTGLYPANAETQQQRDIRLTKASHDLIKLYDAHKMGYTGKGQTIVVIDSGVSQHHDAIKPNLVDGYCSSQVACQNLWQQSGINAGSSRMLPGFSFTDEHGSLVSAIAAGKSNQYFPGGVAIDANIISINNNNGNHEGLLLALDWIYSIRNKYNVAAVVASFGFAGPGDRNNPDSCPILPDMSSRLKKLYDANIAFVAASGNGGAYSNVSYPACSPYSVAVGAVDSSGRITDYSDIGKEITVLAPAEVLGANEYNGYWIGGGTSSSTPVVAGAVAILKQVNPNATVDQIKKALASSKEYRNDIVWGNLPVLNIVNSIEAIKADKYSNIKVSRVVSSNTNIQSQVDVSFYKSEIDSLKVQLSASKDALDSANGIINNKDKALADLANELKSLKAELSLLKENNDSLVKKISKICKVKKKPAFC